MMPSGLELALENARTSLDELNTELFRVLAEALKGADVHHARLVEVAYQEASRAGGSIYNAIRLLEDAFPQPTPAPVATGYDAIDWTPKRVRLLRHKVTARGGSDALVRQLTNDNATDAVMLTAWQLLTPEDRQEIATSNL